MSDKATVVAVKASPSRTWDHPGMAQQTWWPREFNWLYRYKNPVSARFNGADFGVL